ncbi:MAG: hypothetical protein ACOYJD_09170 [Christensenellales bacterium]|jgi:cell division protein FtsL
MVGYRQHGSLALKPDYEYDGCFDEYNIQGCAVEAPVYRPARPATKVAPVRKPITEHQAPAAKPKAKPAAKQKAKPSILAKPGQRVLAVLLVICIFLLGSVLVSRFAAMTSANSALLKDKKELEQMQAQVEALKLEYAQATDMVAVKDRAAKLGMDFPGDDQVVFVELPEINIDVEPEGVMVAADRGDGAAKANTGNGFLAMMLNLLD